LSKQSSGRHRADVEINVLESVEFRSRRSIREAERKKASRRASRAERRERKVVQVIAAQKQEHAPASRVSAATVKPQKLLKRRGFRTFVTMSIASGIFTTVGLPAYAFSPDVAALAGFSTTNAAALNEENGVQGITVAQLKGAVLYERSNYSTTTSAELARRMAASHYLSYSGPSASDYVSNPPYSKLDAGDIMKVANKYVGTPYVFGGENPNGFDCSGFVRFVFAQFGVDLPHSVIAQSHYGIIVKPEDALPGDIVILDDLSHDGIYAGGGNFYHAPRPGDTVKLAKIFTDRVFYVRLGTN
jgi:cell wall-associated NlpC family hydrolase